MMTSEAKALLEADMADHPSVVATESLVPPPTTDRHMASPSPVMERARQVPVLRRGKVNHLFINSFSSMTASGDRAGALMSTCAWLMSLSEDDIVRVTLASSGSDSFGLSAGYLSGFFMFCTALSMTRATTIGVVNAFHMGESAHVFLACKKVEKTGVGYLHLTPPRPVSVPEQALAEAVYKLYRRGVAQGVLTEDDVEALVAGRVVEIPM